MTGKRIMAVLAVVACAMAGMLSVPVGAEAREITSAGTWRGASYTVYDDGSATVTGKFTGYPSSAPDDLRKCTSVDVTGVDVTGVTSLESVFGNWTNLQHVAGLDTWDVSHIDTFYSMFASCSKLVSAPDVSSWKPKDGASFMRMFYSCTSLQDLSGLSDLDVSGADDFTEMFYKCTALRDVSPIEGWRPSSVTNMDEMFYGCTWLSSIDLSKWDTKVTSLERICEGCTGLTTFRGPRSTGSLNDVRRMFNSCTRLAYADVSGLDMSDGHTRETYGMFGSGRLYDSRLGECSNLMTVVLGPNFRFLHDYEYTKYGNALPSISSYGTSPFTGKWVREDGSYGPYNGSGLYDVYTPAMAGTWVRERKPVTYTLRLEGNGGLGSMPSLPFHTDGTADVIPTPAFSRLGYRFLSWNTKADGTGSSYLASTTITTPIYNSSTRQAAVAGDTVTLYAIWQAMPTSAEYAGGMDITLHAGEQVTVGNLPAGASYVVTETPVPSGWTLVRSRGTTGVIVPSVR